MTSNTFEGDGEEVVWNDDSPLSDLLGFDLGAEEGQDRSGLKALINSAFVSHRRLPMLDVIFDRTARLMSTSLRQLTNENIEVTLDNVSSTRFGDFISAQSGAGVIGVIHSKTLDGYAILAADGPLVHGVVDLLLGGRRGASAGLDGRSLTAIELGLATRMLSLLVEDFDEALLESDFDSDDANDFSYAPESAPPPSSPRRSISRRRAISSRSGGWRKTGRPKVASVTRRSQATGCQGAHVGSGRHL